MTMVPFQIIHIHFVTVIFLICVILRTHAFPSEQGHGNRHNKGNGRRSYERRSVDSFDTSLPGTVTLQTLKNASIMMCTNAMAQPYARMVHLSDEHMRAILEEKGGNYIQDYMAATQEEALENFPNMLILTKPISVNGSITSFSLADNLITKQLIIEDLNKLAAFLMKYNSTTDKTEHQSVDNENALGNEYNTKVTFSTKSTHTTSEQKHASDLRGTASVVTPTPTNSLAATTQSVRITNNSNTPPTTNNAGGKYTPKLNIESTTQTRVMETSTAIPVINTSKMQKTSKGTSAPVVKHTTQKDNLYPHTTTEVYTTSSSNSVTSSTANSVTESMTSYPATTLTPKTSGVNTVAMETKTTTKDPAVIKGIQELQHYVHQAWNNVSHLGTRDLDSVLRDANTTLPATTLLGLVAGNRRAKRHADGSYSREEYCQNKGALTDDHRFVHLCSICAATTKLPDDIFPRYINEAVCKTGDTDCFTIAGTSHGQCKQTRFSLNMLRKKVGHCNMIIHGGETLVFEDWELVPQLINVSCECTINKLSVFSKYAGYSVPLG